MFEFNQFKRLKVDLSRLKALKHWNSVAAMPIHQQYIRLGCLFIHIPKTAGISVSTALFGSKQHRSLYQYRLIFGNQFVDNSFRFCIARHPLDRFISAANFLHTGGITDEDKLFSKTYMDNIGSLDDLVDILSCNPSAMKYFHFAPQVDYLCDLSDSPVKIDYVGKFEQLSYDFPRIAKAIGIEAKLPLLNKRKNPTQTLPFSTNVLRWVEQTYNHDYLFFGYDKSRA